MSHVNLENLYQEAIAAFPYPDLQSTSITQGDYLSDDGFVEYAEEYTFTAGHLLNEKLMAGGWIEVRQENDEEPSITAFFGLARNGDWQNGKILPETVAVQGIYDIATQTWELWIDQY